MIYIFQVIIIMLLLVNCSSITNEKSLTAVRVKCTKSLEKSIISTVPRFSKTKKVNWVSVIIPLVNQLTQVQEIKESKVLLIDSIKNNTNMTIQLIPAVTVIIDTISNKNIFKLVSKDIIMNARKTLGLSQEDNLVTCSKSIALARYIKADYVLYSIISGNQQQSKIEMQLIEVQTGEILWLGSNIIE